MPKTDLVILALDDEQALPLFEKALGTAQLRVKLVRDQAALDKAMQDTTPAAVIVSQKFDGGDELVIAGNLLERFPTLPILLFLNGDPSQSLKQALQIGISDCLYAPLRIEDITRSVENSIRRASRIGDWTRRLVTINTASLQHRVEELQIFDSLIENIEDGVIILDDEQNILQINPAARRTFGLWQDDSVKDQPVSKVLPHPDLKGLLNECRNNPIPHSEINFDDGRVYLAQCTPIPKIGLAIGMHDITYLKQIDRLKNEFVHTVSHDLRSPLTAILGYVDLLDRVGPVSDQQREYIHRIQGSVQSITNLVNDLLELGHIESGFDTQKEMVALDGIIRYAVETVHPLLTGKEINLHLNLPNSPTPLYGNPIRLRQMLDNLLGNAIKYTPRKGEISVDLEVQKEQVILCISDTGPGIPPSDQPHIFEKFYRASNVPKEVGGSGLGLAIVKSIVDNHMGRIWVDSMLGMGSSFTVILPLSTQSISHPA